MCDVDWLPCIVSSTKYETLLRGYCSSGLITGAVAVKVSQITVALLAGACRDVAAGMSRSQNDAADAHGLDAAGLYVALPDKSEL